MLKRSFAEPVSTQTFSESLNLSPEPERDKSFLGNTRSALNLKDASDAEILQAYRQKYPDLSGASDDELAMALETRYNKAGFGERLVKTAGERSLENVSNVFDMGRAPVGDKEKRRREALSGLLPELKGDYKYYGGSDPFYMPEGEGFSAGVAEFLGTVLADLPLMAAAGVGGAGVTAKVGLSGVKGLTAREAIAGSLFAQTRKYDNERERLIGTLEEGALWAGMGVAGHYAGKGLKALAGKLRKGKGAISAGERAEVERELRNVEAAGTSPEKENWAAARAARTTPQEAAGYEWSGPKPGDSPFMRSQVEQKAAEEAQRVADGSHGTAWREFRQRRNPKLLPGGEIPRSANAAEVRTGRPEVRGEEPVDYTPKVVGVDAAGMLPGSREVVGGQGGQGGRYGRNGRRLIGDGGGVRGARVEFTGGAPELPGRNTGLPVGERAGGTLSALQFRSRQAGLGIFDRNGKPYSEAFLKARERARGGVVAGSGKAIETPDAELRGVYAEAARLGIETVNKEGKPYSKTFLNLRINKAVKTKRETVKPVDAGGQGGVGGQEHVPAGGEFMGLEAEKNPQVVDKPVVKRETANVRRETKKQPWEMTREGFAKSPNTTIFMSESFTKEDKMIPANMFNGKIYKGRKGENHGQIIDRTNTPYDKTITGFVDKNNNFIYQNPEYSHKLIIEQALAEGKAVPERVLADYPELGKAKVEKPVGSGVTVTEKKVTPEQVAKRETSNVRRERVKPKREKKVKDTLDDSEIDMRLKGIFNYGNKKILDDFVSVLSPRQLEKYNKTIERLSGVLGKRNEKRGPVAQFLTNYQRNTDLLKEKVNAFENGENKPSVDTIKQLIERQNKLVDEGIKTHGYNDFELEYGDDFIFDKPELKKALEEKGYKVRENKLEDVEVLKEIPDYPELTKGGKVGGPAGILEAAKAKQAGASPARSEKVQKAAVKYGKKKEVLNKSEKTPIIEEKTITGGKEMGISEYKGEAVFNKYSKENLGDSFVENGVKYELTGTVTNKSGVIKSYKYSPALTHEQEILNLKVQGNKETEYLKNKSEFVTRDLIKKINRKFKGKIEGKSDTTASMYSRLNNDIRVRVSDHSPVALRSDADINVWSNDGVVFHVGEDAIVEKGVNESIEDVYNKIIESLDNEIKVKSENLKQVRQERKYIRDLNNLGGGGDLEPPGLMGAKPEIEGAGASPARSEKVQKEAVKYGSKKPKEQLELMKVQAEMPRGKIGKTSEPIEGSQGVGMFKTEPKKVEQEELFGVGKNKKISVMDEETYLSINGADRQDIGDSALHKNLPYGKVRDRILDRQAKKDTELIEKRDRLRKEYREKIDRGELREPTRFEKLVNTAHGMSEKEAVQAARRILKKNGIDWKKSSVGNIVKNSEQAGAKDVTKSESFKKWFGDWEKDPVNASKVVDEQGRPLVVYHTGSMGNVYDMKKSRSYSGSPDYELPGIYTTSNKQESAAYGSKEQIKELYVSIKNPFTGDVNELQQRLGSYRKVMDHLKKNGYDGFIDKELDEYVAFSPEQIKSAIGNRGTFDTGDANILHGKAWPAGAVAGVEKDEDGNVTFDAGKAVKGMAAMAVGEAGIKMLARNAKNAGRMGIVAPGFEGKSGKPVSEKVARAASRYGSQGKAGEPTRRPEPAKPKTRNEIYDEAAKYVGKHGRNTVLRDSWEGTKEVANKLFVPVASRLERINPRLGRKLRRHEFDLGMRITRDVKAVTPFMEVTKKMTPVEKLVLDIARKNGDDEKILELMHRYGGVEQYQAYRKVMDDVYKRAKEVGFDLDYRLHYHPRMVKDKRGFLKYFEMSEDWSAIEAAMKEQAAKLQRPLTEDEKVNLVNSLLRGFQKTKIGLPETGSMKERTIEQIDFALNKFYYDSNSSLQMYLNAVNDRIESRRFFGIHGRTAKGKGWMPDMEKTFGVNDAGIEKQEDLKDSIGAYVLDLIKKGEITASNENQVREILQARFHQQGAHGIVALYKNLSYMETMGSFASALTQLGDVAYSLYRTGFYGTAKNIVKSAKTLKDPAAQMISLEDIGVDRIAQEFMAEGNSGKWLDRVFKMTGLTTLDRMGELTYINAVMDKYMKLARNEKPGGGLADFVLNKESKAEFMGRLERVFGKDTDKVLADLKAGKVTEDVRYLAFSELLGIQPVALSEMPQNYLSGGNGRIFYMLKTYSLKQWDAYRREALDLMKTDPKRGMRNMMYLSGALLGCNASADMLKNLMLNRDTEPDDLVVDNVARLFGLSKWTIYEARREGAATAAMKMMLPPGKFLDAAYKDVSDTYRYFVDDVEVRNYGAKNLNLFGSIPLVGKPYFWWFGKGSEWEKNKSKPRKKGSAKVERARRRYGRRRSR